MRQDEDETPKIAEVYSKLYTNGFAPVPSALASTEQLRAVLQLMDDLETTEWWRSTLQ